MKKIGDIFLRTFQGIIIGFFVCCFLFIIAAIYDTQTRTRCNRCKRFVELGERCPKCDNIATTENTYRNWQLPRLWK